MKRKKRKIFRTPEERAAWEAHFQARMRALKHHHDRIRAELAAEGRLEGRAVVEFPDF
jgi:hypothetical protein